MPVKWTPDTHEQLLVAIIASGIISSWSSSAGLKIVEAWPKDKPAPTVSALTQHLNSLMKKHGATPSTASGRGAATRSAPASRRRGTASSKPRYDKTGKSSKRMYREDTDDAEEDDEEVIKPSPSATPAPRGRNTGHDHAIPRRATLSPPSGLVERSSKRARHDSPIFIKSENEGVVDLSGDSDDDTPSKTSYAFNRMRPTERPATLQRQEKVHQSRFARCSTIADDDSI